MTKNETYNTKRDAEKVVLVGVQIRDNENLLTIQDSLEELELLADTAGMKVVGQIEQKLNRPNPKTFIGQGKVEEIKILSTELAADVVLFDDELNPRHQRELEAAFGENIKVLDRTALILDIFAQHASTHEGSLQVELAQYEYRLPRLTRAWTHLARQAGGGGGRAGSAGGVGLRGPGEKQLEVDRRDIGRRISFIKKELEKVREHRSRHRSRRKQTQIPVVALVGYTNAGKSTLLNKVSGSEVYIADKLFATLDPTTRSVNLPGKTKILLTDTVGFIQKLPTTLVAAFRATLEEITEADLLLHVIDINHQNAYAQSEAVLETLKDIGADHIPVLTVMNKIDLLEDPNQAKENLAEFEDAVAISASEGLGFEELTELISEKLFETFESIKVELPYSEGALIAKFHEVGNIDEIKNTRKSVIIKGKIPIRIVAKYKKFEI
jgi:GTP-binding protein HflX